MFIMEHFHETLPATGAGVIAEVAGGATEHMI